MNIMAWKCSKCGMPNFEDDICKLCGAEKPENPEEFIEETTESAAEASAPEFEPVVIEYGPEEEEVPTLEETPIPEEIPEPEMETPEIPEEPVPENEPETKEPEPVEEVETEPETEAVPEQKAEVAPVAEESAPEEAPASPVVPAPETKVKKRSKLPLILLIWVLIIAAAAYYLFVLKGDFMNNDTQTPTSVPAISQSAIPSAEPTEEPEVLEESPLPEETPVASETPVVSEPPVEVITPPTPVETPVPTKTPAPAPKVTKKYKIYTSNDYSFYAAYPVDFSTKTNLHDESLLHLASYEDKVDMVIGGTKNWKKLSAKAALKQFLSYFSGTVLESSSGDTWYSATVNENSHVTRRKAFVKNGNICYVEFTYQESDEAEFLPCMNYVLDHFVLMK